MSVPRKSAENTRDCARPVACLCPTALERNAPHVVPKWHIDDRKSCACYPPGMDDKLDRKRAALVGPRGSAVDYTAASPTEVREMLIPIARRIASRSVLRSVVRSVGGAALAGLGWKLGSDAYEVAKKRVKESREQREQQEETPT